ncbi:uncharacterized protein At4g04775-like [Brassica rapa]|uniref:uncharacterized protein At4g04775-like n=1 Tax=Brassica campestris TaxID=3711 RepID=UPI0004F16C5A|nr:uncharacterized protein At4g04775-like [Brassica rapa]
MSGSSNIVSGATSGASNARRRGGRFVGVPKKCWCGESIIPLMSNSTPNPYRRYFRCAYAAKKRLENDDHRFKWIDEAILEELESLECKNASIEQYVKEIARERLVVEKEVLDRVEAQVLDRVEAVLAEEKTKMKKLMIVLGIGGVICVGSMVLLSFKKW